MNVPDIPKIYTALAEWFSCCVFVLALEKRYKKCYTICVLLPFLPVFCVLQYYIEMCIRDSMNIADLRGRAIISERGCSAKLLIIPQVLMSVFLIWRKP